MAAAFLEFDLTRELAELEGEPLPASGKHAKTLVKYDNLRIVLMVLKAHTRIPGHQADGRISIHVIRGRIRLRALERTFELGVGGLLALDQNVTHDVEAVDDSVFLLTIAWPKPSGGV